MRVLIIGCGDIALRAAALLGRRVRLYGLIRDPAKARPLRKLGITPVIGDLDDPSTLKRLAGLADVIWHFAPPATLSDRDTRTANLLTALKKHSSLPHRLVYISTSGVYGDCAGALVSEQRLPAPQSPRAVRRVDAERRVRGFCGHADVQYVILRVPGIYADDRLPLARLRAGTPTLCDEDDGYTNHIHADDLARVAVIATFRGVSGRAVNVVDDSRLTMSAYFDLVADWAGLPRPGRISKADATGKISPEMLSFMKESRQLDNTRLKRELRFRLAHPTVAGTLRSLAAPQKPA